MNKFINGIILLLILVSCSEPIDFNFEGNNQLIVLDAQVSQIRDESYVKIYRNITSNQKVTKEGISQLEVQFIAKSGQIIPLIEDKEAKGLYQPLNVDFVGIIGEEYRLLAQSPDDYSIISEYDMLQEPVDFDLIIEKTTTAILEEANELAEITVFNAVAEIQPNKSYYSKFSFYYKYDHYWYPEFDSTTINTDNFLLYSCTSDIACEQKQSLLIGSEFDQNWRFSESTCYDTINPFNVNTCPEYCCIAFEDWTTNFFVRQEAMSFETYTYWKRVDQLINNDGLVFDTPPFTIKGNVSCDNCEYPLVGLFRAVGLIEKSKYVVL